jgi:hypothetical protein
MKFKTMPVPIWESTRISLAREAAMARKAFSGFAEAGTAMAQQLDDNDLLNLFSTIGRVVSKWFLMKRPSLSRWTTRHRLSHIRDGIPAA